MTPNEWVSQFKRLCSERGLPCAKAHEKKIRKRMVWLAQTPEQFAASLEAQVKKIKEEGVSP